MSNIEHLIENAIFCLEHDKTFEDFLEYKFNSEMLKLVKSLAEEIWEMAIYVYYPYRESVIWETEERMEKAYGYKLPE